jgi:hypothetical protein
MSIFIIDGAGSISPVTAKEFPDELALQNKISDFPKIFSEINGELVILAKEYPAGTNRIDILACDKDGNVYVIETKLIKNSDKRRTLAQVLDYGAALWSDGLDISSFMDDLNQAVLDETQTPLADYVNEKLNLDPDSLNRVLDNIKTNISEGCFRFVIVMDSIDEGLKDLITYLNSKSSFKIIGLSLEHYEVDKNELLITKLFGDESLTSQPARTSQKWTKEQILAKAREIKWNDGFIKVIETLFSEGEKLGYELRLGRGRTDGSLIVRGKYKGENVELFQLWVVGGTLDILLGDAFYVEGSVIPELREFKDKIINQFKGNLPVLERWLDTDADWYLDFSKDTMTAEQFNSLNDFAVELLKGFKGLSG